MSSYIYFELIEEKPKTYVYAIKSKSSDDRLGTLKYYPNWRQYCFFTEPGYETIWSVSCLNEVIHFIGVLKQKLAQQKNQNKRR